MTMKRPNAFTPLTLRAGPPISPPAAAPALPAAPLIQPLPRHRTWRTMLLGSATFAVAGLLQGTAFAQCDTTPTTGNDSITCNSGDIDDQTIDALAGEDTIRVFLGTSIGVSGNATISGGADADEFNLNPFSIAQNLGSQALISGDGGDDTISVSGAVVGNAGSATVSGGEGADQINLNSSFLASQSGSQAQILGDAGNDTILISSSALAPSGAATVDGGADNDSITLTNSASVGALGVIQGGAGDDTIALDNSVTWNAAASFDGGEGTDTLQFTAAGADTIDASNFAGFENLFKDGSDTLTLTGAHTFSSNVDIDAGTLNVAGSLT
ncbi:MAG: autotransporter-associated beta strand repeat-containing protein, partial [Pseudomonadota bacterium]